MKRFGTISYNIYCNFTNYGSALQTWALHQVIKKIGENQYQPILIDYCPDILVDKDPLNPFENMWDNDDKSKEMCKLSLPAIYENYIKFERFYHERFTRTKIKYTSENFNDVIHEEQIDGFICGSDTIFCIDEFGFDDGFYANYDCMKNGYTVSYAASFGDPYFTEKSYQILNKRLQNFKAIGLREDMMIPYVKEQTTVPVKKVLDPTLLLTSEDYDMIAEKRQEEAKYLLLYARRCNTEMSAYAEELAEKNGWKVIEISLQAINAEKHKMFYEAGVEEFISLIKYAECVITNSFHGMIFSVQYHRPFYVFSREQCNTKITELLDLLGLLDRMKVTGNEPEALKIDYKEVHKRIDIERKKSLSFLEFELNENYQQWIRRKKKNV